MDWPIETSLEFLQLYEQEPVIWNPKDPRHRNRNAINEAWLRIHKSLSVKCPIQDLKRKRESLMATFRPLWRAKINRELSGGSDDGHKSNWFAFDAMARFLGGVYQPKIFSSDEITNDIFQDDYNYEEINDGPSDNLNDTSKPEYTSTFSVAGGSKERTKRKVLEHPVQTRQSDNDECSLFTQLLVRRLRSFDEKTREILMNKIDNLVFQAKMRKLEREAQSYSSSSAYYPSIDPFASIPATSANHIDTRLSTELDTRLRDDNSSNSVEFIVKEETEMDDFSDVSVSEINIHNPSNEKVPQTNKKFKC